MTRIVVIPVLVRSDRTTEMSKILRRLGFQRIRQRGSHAFFRHPDGRATVVPMHKARELPRGTIRNILRDVGITVEEMSDYAGKLNTHFQRRIPHRHLRPNYLGRQTHHRTPLITGAPPEFLEKDFLQTYANKTLPGT